MQQYKVVIPVLLLVMVISNAEDADVHMNPVTKFLTRVLDALPKSIPSGPRRFSRATRNQGTAAVRWRSCGSRKDPVQLQTFNIKPNPVRVPGPISIDLALLIREPVPAPLKVQLRVSKEVELPLGLGSTWLEIPCPNDACAVPDACASTILPREGSQCPAPANSTVPWIPCTCPIPKGLYVMPTLQFNLTQPVRGLLPDFLLNGGVQAQLKLSRRKRRLACVQTTIDLDL